MENFKPKTPAQEKVVDSETAKKIEQPQKTEVASENLGENKNTENFNTWVKLENHVFDENNFYRIIDEKGYKDYEENNIVRSSPTGTDPHMAGRFNIGNRPTSFPSFSKGIPDFSFTRKGSNNYILESDMPMYKAGEGNPVTGFKIPMRHWAYRPIDQKTGDVIKEMRPDMIKNIYKLDTIGDLYLKK